MLYMNYDYALQINGIEYGIITGNELIVFIKVGLGGSYSGYEDKYLKMSSLLNEKYGCSVIVASNPNDGKGHVDCDKQIIEKYLSDHRLDSHEIFFFGHSNGGVKGLELSNAGIVFKKMVLVNMPLMINFHRTKRYILAAPNTEIVAIYAEHDPSTPYIPFIDGKYENLKVVRFPLADHNFDGLTDEFIALSEYLFSGR